MSKAETIDALIDSATRCFSRDGFDGASLRAIARDAGVPLSTIHHYFGGKADLFTTVGREAWRAIDSERAKLLGEALDGVGDGAPQLAPLLHALALPVVRRALDAGPRGQAELQLLRSHTGRSRRASDGPMLQAADRSIRRWIDAIARACPALSRQDVIWAFSFAVGAIYSWQLLDHRYDALLGADSRRGVDEVTSDIVAFCRGGIEALAAQRGDVGHRCDPDQLSDRHG